MNTINKASRVVCFLLLLVVVPPVMMVTALETRDGVRASRYTYILTVAATVAYLSMAWITASYYLKIGVMK